MSDRDALDIAAKDWNDAYIQGIDALRIADTAWAQQAETGKGTPPPLKPITLKELLEMQLKARETVLEGLLLERGIGMVYSWRGVGKTWIALNLNYAIATGGTFLRWKAPKARKVFHIDGEMPVVGLRERLAPIIAMNDGTMPKDDYFRLLPADYYEFGLPNLATTEGQDVVDQLLGDAEVVTFDNVSTLFISGRENETESWLPVQAWLLKLRRQGRSVIIAHHAGKGKAQRGTSSREDILDVVLNLRRPPDYDPSQGARFEVHFEKARGLLGNPTDPFEAWLQTVNGNPMWTMRTLEDAQAAEIIELNQEGKSVRQIAKELDISKSAVQRVIAKAKVGQ